MFRAIVFWIVWPLATALSWFFATLALVFDPRRGRVAHLVERAWGHVLVRGAGARLRVEGAEKVARDRPRVFVANHASYLDPPALFAALPAQVRYVLKRELKRMPFVGWYCGLGGHFFLDRSDPREGLETVRRASERARRYGLSPTVFAEGTRSVDGRLAPFKSGAFHLALAAGLEVQPIAILGTHEILPKHARRPRRGGTVVVRIGDAIPTEGLAGGAGRKTLAERTRAALLALGVPDGSSGNTAP